ncbi:MAG: molybdopterin-dependent oxidoreductase [Ilumatobacteraceae bacterium]
MERRVTYCRICPATCGLVVDVEDGRVVRAVGDQDNPLTRGFSCPKGRHIGDFLSAPGRLHTSLRRVDGIRQPIGPAVAVAEIAARLRDVVDAHGPGSVGLYSGTQSAFATLTGPFAAAWWSTIGSPKRFSTMTIDQSAMWVADGRLGAWAAGIQRFDTADVWMLVGTNPPISLQGGEFTGFPIHDPTRRLQEAKRRGLQLIVVDPRRTEVAARADIHLQLRPGTDAALFAGLLHVLLRDGLTDTAFCERWVDGVDDLRRAVERCTPELVADRCGLTREEIEGAAHMFGTAGSGMALSGTGPDMGPDSNLAEHLIRSLNVVCGRFPREGEQIAGTAVFSSVKAPPAEVIAPDRTWEHGYRSRLGYGLLKGQLPTASLVDEILQPGPDRIRALFVSGGNPAAAMPDQTAAVEALSSLDLLVTVDPFLSETARLADYVVAPMMHLERPDISRVFESVFEEPFAMVTPAIVEPPADVIDDWEFWLRLAWAGGHTVRVFGREYPPASDVPSTDEVLASLAGRSRVPLADVAAHEHGAVYPELDPPRVGPPTNDASGRFALLPADVAAELDTMWAAGPSADGEPYRLVVRRTKETINSLGTRIEGLPRHPYNPCHCHPQDLASLGLVAGDVATIASGHGRITAVMQADSTMRRGVVSMTHAFGGLPDADGDDDPLVHGANPTRLLSLRHGVQTINAMPVMTAIPVTIVPVG